MIVLHNNTQEKYNDYIANFPGFKFELKSNSHTPLCSRNSAYASHKCTRNISNNNFAIMLDCCCCCMFVLCTRLRLQHFVAHFVNNVASVWQTQHSAAQCIACVRGLVEGPPTDCGLQALRLKWEQQHRQRGGKETNKKRERERERYRKRGKGDGMGQRDWFEFSSDK